MKYIRQHHSILILLTILFVCSALAHEVAYAQAPAPVITQLLPSSKMAGEPGFLMTVLGSQIPANASVYWNGTARTTSLFAPGILEANITAADIAVAGIVQVTVAAPGGAVSNVLPFSVSSITPAAVISHLAPSEKLAGSPGFTLTVVGSGFVNLSVVMWNGLARPTTFIDNSTLTAEILAEDIALPGNVPVTVIEAAPGGLSSAPVTFSVLQFTTRLFFPQLAVGGGYTSTLTLLNNGIEAATATVTITSATGAPLLVKGTRSAAVPVDLGTNSVFLVTVPALGVRILTFTDPDNGSVAKNGWARVVGETGNVKGVLTFQRQIGTQLTGLASVLSADQISAGLIPIDNNWNLNRQVGFAIANQGTNDIHIRFIVFDEDGNVLTTLDAPDLNPLRPGQQISKFLWQYFPQYADFRGSVMIVATEADARFIAVALSMNRDLMTVIPILPDVLDPGALIPGCVAVQRGHFTSPLSGRPVCRHARAVLEVGRTRSRSTRLSPDGKTPALPSAGNNPNHPGAHGYPLPERHRHDRAGRRQADIRRRRGESGSDAASPL